MSKAEVDFWSGGLPVHKRMSQKTNMSIRCRVFESQHRAKTTQRNLTRTVEVRRQEIRRVSSKGQPRCGKHERTVELDRDDCVTFSASGNVSKTCRNESPKINSKGDSSPRTNPRTLSRDSPAKDCAVSKAGFFRFFSLKNSSQPATDRVLYRSMPKDRARRIVEIGVGDGTRAENLISVALRFHKPEEIKYTGVDLFEARENATEANTLKQVHRRLKATQAEVRLMPGDARSALPRCANDLRGTDWVIISADQDEEATATAWNYLPRMLHKTSKVWLGHQDGFEILTAKDVTARLMEKSSQRRAA